MKKIALGVLGVLVTALVFVGPALAEDSDNKENSKSVKDTRGLRFSVPDDWPIERVGNTIGPIPMEEYMSRKFAAMNERLKKQEETIAALEKRVAQVESSKRLGA